MRDAPLRSALALSCLVVAGSCTIVNHIDACDAPTPKPVGANQQTEGRQALDGSRAVTVLPTGEALVMFGTTVAGLGTAAGSPQEIHAVRLSATGAPLDGCVRRDEREQALFPVAVADPKGQVTTAVQVLPPPSAAGVSFTGLALMTFRSMTSPLQVVATTVLPNGCFLPNNDVVPIGAATATRSIEPADVGPLAVALPTQGKVQRYAIFWTEVTLAPARYHVMSRLLDVSGGQIDFAPSDGAADGAAVDLALIGPLVVGLGAVVTGPDDLWVVWGAATTASSYKLLGRHYDTHLRPKDDPAILATNLSLGAINPGHKVTVSFDGAHVLVVTVEGDPDGTSRAWARTFLSDGRQVGGPVRLGAAPTANDSYVNQVALPDGGFVAAWRQQLGAVGAAGAVELRALALDTTGRPAFTNPACDEADFRLVAAKGGDVGRVSLSVADDGRVVAGYTEAGDTQTGLSQSDVGVVGFTARDLFPKSKARPASSATPTISSAPRHVLSTHASCSGPTAGKPSRACRCDETCDSNATCLTEELGGSAGGSCFLPCDPRVATSCPTGTVCDESGVNPATKVPEGICKLPCDTNADCGVGRICYPELHRCAPFCASDADCKTGTCDVYSKRCGAPMNPTGRGLLASCVTDNDCRSGYCEAPDDPWYPKRCGVDCLVAQPKTCPESALCVPLGSDGTGVCVPPCVGGTCANPQLDCYQLKDFTPKVCLAP